MAIINMHQAKSELSDLVARAEAGEEIVIARRNKPAVRLVPVEVHAPSALRKKRRIPGSLSHLRGALPEDLFLTPTPTDELDAWEGKYSFDGST